MSENLSGSRLGPYQVGEPIGVGGIGQVYQAVHIRTGRSYALKVLTDTDDSALPRFRREAEALAAIGHPGVVAIHDFDESAEGIAYLVMDRLEGVDLSRRIARAPLPLEEALDRFDEVADALMAAHKAGVLHRDLKPSNIFLKREASLPERAVLLDFGLAKSVDPDRTKLTASGQTMGTPLYMSPEQALGEELDVRSDVYSLSAVLYEMLCGAPPFDGPNLTAILSKVLMVPPQPLRMRGVELPDELEALILRALGKGRDGRPSTVSEFRTLVRATRTDTPASIASHALSEPVLPRTRATPKFVPERKSHRGRFLAAGLFTVIACIAVAIGVMWSPAVAVVPQEIATPNVPATLIDDQQNDHVAPLPSTESLTGNGEAEATEAEARETEGTESESNDATSAMAPARRHDAREVGSFGVPPSDQSTSTQPTSAQPTSNHAPHVTADPSDGTTDDMRAATATSLASWNATIDAAEARIDQYERVIRWLDQAERRGTDASTVCRAPGEVPDVPADYQPRSTRGFREHMCEKLQEVDGDAAQQAVRVRRLRDSFDRARRSLATRSDEVLPAADRAELLQRIARVEQLVRRDPFPCFNPSFASLNDYARDLGPRAAQPALEISRAVDSICRLQSHLRDREQRYGTGFDLDRETARRGIDSQEGVIRTIREQIQRYAPR